MATHALSRARVRARAHTISPCVRSTDRPRPSLRPAPRCSGPWEKEASKTVKKAGVFRNGEFQPTFGQWLALALFDTSCSSAPPIAPVDPIVQPSPLHHKPTNSGF